MFDISKIKNAVAQRLQPAQDAPAEDPHEQQTPYGGCIDGVPVKTAPHLIVTGPTGRGKTTRILVPGALMWVGPRVTVSSKADYFKWLVECGIHRRGPLYVLDLAGEIRDDASWLEGIEYTRVTSDPSMLITGDDDAMEMAYTLMASASIVAGNGGGGGDDAFWQNLSGQVLAALLLAGKASGQGITWTTRAIGRIQGKDAEDTATPSWVAAMKILRDSSIHTEELETTMAMEDKLRDSVIATMKAAVKAWNMTTVSGRNDSRDTVPFTPEMLVPRSPEEEPTLVILVGPGPAAPAAVAAVETIIKYWRRGIEDGLPRVLLSIDEFANTCPIPNISTYLSEARGLGVACVLAVQSTEGQLEEKYGQARAKSIREVSPAVLILEGDPSSQILTEKAAWWDGEHDVWRETIAANNERSRTAERAQVTSAQSLLPQNDEEGRLLLFGRKGHMVELPGIWEL